MGVDYYVVCDDCKVRRDLDKFYAMVMQRVDTRKKALSYQTEIRKEAFRAGLLVSFLGKHIGHKCRVIDDCGDAFDEIADDYPDDGDFWGLSAAQEQPPAGRQ